MAQSARLARTAALLLVFAGGCKSGGNAGGVGTGAGASCAVGADCAPGLVCVVGPVGGRCAVPGTMPANGECAATRDCAAGLYCTPLGKCGPAGIKIDGDNCGADAECKAGLRCLYDGFFGHCGAGGTVDVGGTCTASAQCLAGLWCSPTGVCKPILTAFPPFAGAACADSGAFRSYFEVPRPQPAPQLADFFRLPFPNDARVTNGKLDLSDFPRPGPTPLGVDLVQLYVDTWVADFDGFGTTPQVTFRFSDKLDFDTASSANVHLVDLTDGPGFGYELGRQWGYTNDRNKYACQHRLNLGAGLGGRFVGGHVYAAFLTTGVKSEAGVPAVQDPDLVAVLGEVMPAAGDAALANAWTAYAPFRRFLTMNGTAASSVANVAVFTTQDPTAHVQRLAAAVAGQPPPALKQVTVCDTGVTSPCDDGTDRLRCPAASPVFHEIHGKMTIPIYQQGTPPYDAPEQGGGIREAAGTGVPELARTEDVCFALAVPKTAVAPAAGWPLVVYHHGTGGSMRSFIEEGLAQAMAAAARPAAVLSFEAVEHGARRGASTKKPDDLVFNPLNPRAARDNFLQGAADILQALRVAGLTVDAAPAAPAVKFDATKVTFFGHSQGSTSGELALPFAPGVQAAVLSGAGAWLAASLQYKTSPVNISSGMRFLIGEPIDPSHPAMVIFQSFFERSDPLNYNPMIVSAPPAGTAPKHVLMTWGTGDTYTPKETLRANAESLDIPPVAPVLEEIGTQVGAPIDRPVTLNKSVGDQAAAVQRTAAVFQYASSGYDGHFVAQRNATAQSDWLAFLQSYLATGTPTVP